LAEIKSSVVEKTLKIHSLKKQCGFCRADLPDNIGDYTVNFHNVADINREEHALILCAAMFQDRVDILRYITLVREKIGWNGVDAEGRTPIWQAARNNRIETVKFLAAQKVDLNRAHKDARTPVYVAAKKGNIAIVEFLASQQKIELNRADKNGRTPVYAAA
jgi:ankyrin repeat protein